jgi:hypothetical protein
MKNRINIIKFTASLLASIAAVGAPALLITSCHNGVSDAISDGASKAIPKPFDLSNVSFNDKYNQTLYVDDNTKVTSTELASIPLDSALRTFICSTVNAASSKAKISLDNFDSNLIITTDLTPGDYSNARTYTYHLKAVTSSTVVMGSKDFDVSLTATNKPTLSITGGAYMNQGYDKQSGATSAFTCNISEGDLPTITWNTIK